MDEKKMIPCIYMSMGRAVTGFGQKTIFEDGDLLKLAREYGNTGADVTISNLLAIFPSKRSVRKQKFR